eukprot:3699094-Rhodomonas_salina.1
MRQKKEEKKEEVAHDPGHNKLVKDLQRKVTVLETNTELAYGPVTCGTELAYGPVTCGAELAYGASRKPRSCSAVRRRPSKSPPPHRERSSSVEGTFFCLSVSGATELPHGRRLQLVRYSTSIFLRASYALSGTDLAYGPICLRASYALSGTDLAYGRMSLRASYVRFGSDLAYGRMSLRVCYALSGTDLVYDATGNTRGRDARTAAP